jgi:hypothetical protein
MLFSLTIFMFTKNIAKQSVNNQVIVQAIVSDLSICKSQYVFFEG